MYAYHIASRLLTVYGSERARSRVKTRLGRWKATLSVGTLTPIHSSICTMRPDVIAYRYARIMLWQSVANSLENEIASRAWSGQSLDARS